MHFLLTNDDGIAAPGLWAAARTLTSLGSVLVVAPASNYSGYGPAHPPEQSIAYQRYFGQGSDLPNVVAYALSATPAACAHIALSGTFGRQPVDMVVSGIKPALDACEPMAEAIRKVLREQFEVMLANENGSRMGDNVEPVHDMRVAVRRMRTAFRLFGDSFQRGSIKRFQKDLRAMGRALGAVRDLDVFNREAVHYLRQQPKRRRHDLDPRIPDPLLIELPFPNTADVIDALLFSYLDEQRRPSTTFFVLDVSGSMEGEGLQDLKTALANLTGLDQSLTGQFARVDRWRGR